MCRLLLAAAISIAAVSAAAEPLTYPIRALDPVVLVSLAGDAEVTYAPPLLPPTTVSLLDGISTLQGRPRGSAVADVELPDAFLNGANGILLSSFEAETTFNEAAVLLTDIFSQLPEIPSPVPLVGAAFLVEILDLTLRLDEPMGSPLTSTGENQWAWLGQASLTVEGNLNLAVLIPGQEPIGLPAPIPFSQPISPAVLTGAFSGDATSTTLDIGVAALELEPDVASHAVPIDLGALGSIHVNLTRLELVLDASYTGVNRQYGIAPGGGGVPGCGIGPELALLLPALGWLRRRRLA
jgi:hypothetical protein